MTIVNASNKHDHTGGDRTKQRAVVSGSQNWKRVRNVLPVGESLTGGLLLDNGLSAAQPQGHR